MLKLQIILGSTRPGRSGKAIAGWAYETAQKRTDVKIELVDVAHYNLPLLDEELPPLVTGLEGLEYSKAHTRKWAKKIAEADGYIFVTAEYNRTIPGALKNAIDFLYREWNEKAAGFIGYGAEGAARAIAHLRNVAGEVRLADVREELLFHMHHDFTDNTFKPSARHEDQLNKMIDQVAQWAGAMKSIRSVASSS